MRTATGVLVLAALLALGCGGPDAAPPSDDATLDAAAAPVGAGAAAEPGEWIALFDGDDLSAWRGYKRDDVPGAWRVQDGLLVFVPGEGGGDLITRDRFDDFELVLEWRVQPGGNSGVFYRATEEDDLIWHGAPEMQILDDARHADGGDRTTSAGAAYALYPAPAGVVRPAGEWNAVRLVARGPGVEHWLNGVKVADYEIGSEDWNRRVAASKFSELSAFGRARAGHIGLQDHGDTVWFRDIRVRRLPGADR